MLADSACVRYWWTAMATRTRRSSCCPMTWRRQRGLGRKRRPQLTALGPQTTVSHRHFYVFLHCVCVSLFLHLISASLFVLSLFLHFISASLSLRVTLSPLYFCFIVSTYHSFATLFLLHCLHVSFFLHFISASLSQRVTLSPLYFLLLLCVESSLFERNIPQCVHMLGR